MYIFACAMHVGLLIITVSSGIFFRFVSLTSGIVAPSSEPTWLKLLLLHDLTMHMIETQDPFSLVLRSAETDGVPPPDCRERERVLLVAVARAEREGERPQHVQISLVISPLIWIKQRGPRQKTEVDPLQLIQSSGPLTCGLSEPLSSTVTAEGPDLKKHGTTRTTCSRFPAGVKLARTKCPAKVKFI
jgi:hypothetical protein